MEEKNMNPAAQLLDDEELTKVSGGTYGRDSSGLWWYVMESVYFPQLEKLAFNAQHSEDRAIIHVYMHAIMDTYSGYQGDKVALIEKLWSDSKTADFIDKNLQEQVVSVLTFARGFANRY